MFVNCLYFSSGFAVEEDTAEVAPTLYVDKVNQVKSRVDAIKDKQEDRVQKREERMEKHCEVVTERLEARLEKFSENKDEHETYYTNLQQKISTILTNLADLGYDTTALEEDADTLDGLVQEYFTEYELFIDLIESTQDYVCGESSGDFVSGVKAARDQLKVVHEKRKEIRKFYIDEIREDIKELRKQTPSIEVEDVMEE